MKTKRKEKIGGGKNLSYKIQLEVKIKHEILSLNKKIKKILCIFKLKTIKWKKD